MGSLLPFMEKQSFLSKKKEKVLTLVLYKRKKSHNLAKDQILKVTVSDDKFPNHQKQKNCMKRRNSQFRIFFGHGSKCKHESPMGTQKSTVSDRRHRTTSCRFPTQMRQRGINILHYCMTTEKIFKIIILKLEIYLKGYQ